MADGVLQWLLDLSNLIWPGFATARMFSLTTDIWQRTTATAAVGNT